MDWDATRADFPTLQRRAYLNTCSLGALSRQSRAAVNEFLDLWEEHGASAWYKIWLGEVQRTRERFARLIGAGADEIAILPNVSSALGVLASATPDDGNVVSAAMDFPTIPYQWHARPRMEVRLAPSVDGIRTPIAEYERLADDRTRWIATSHVFYTSGAIQDARRLADVAHARGALFLLDAYQATGQLPTDVKALGVDAYVTGGLKWLLGGPGIAYLYVRRELHERLSPQATGWFAHAEQFQFDTSAFRPHADARRFEAGTPALAAVYAGGAGLDIILKLGPPAIRARTSDLVRELYDRLSDAGFQLATPEKDDERAGIVMVRHPDPPRAVKALRDRHNIVVDHRPGRIGDAPQSVAEKPWPAGHGCIRVSPYFYNTSAECERLVDALSRI